jgi:hypothetical protein
MTYRIQFGFILAAMLLSGTAASGQSNGFCTAGTLTSYISGVNEGCTVGIEAFSFSSLTTSGNGVAYTASNIEVDPVFFPDGASAGFTFCVVQTLPGCSDVVIPFQVASGETAIYNIPYQFYFTTDPAGNAASEAMDPPFGNVSINQYYCADAQLTVNPTNGMPECIDSGSPQILNVNDSNPPATWNTGIVPLNPVINYDAGILTMIELDGTNRPAGFDSVTNANYIDNFIPNPEPSALVLAAGGLLALALRKRFC